MCHRCCDVMLRWYVKLYCYIMSIWWGKEEIITTGNHLRIGWTLSKMNVRRRGSAHGLGVGCKDVCVCVLAPTSPTDQQRHPSASTPASDLFMTNSSELAQTRVKDVQQSRLAPKRRHTRCPVIEKRLRFYVSDLSSFSSLLSLRQLHWVRETRVVLRR